MIVLDSSFLVAFHNTRDVHHPAATEAMQDVVAGRWGRAVLLEYVFLEVLTVLMARRGLLAASRVASILLEARELDFVPCSEFFLDILETFRTQSQTKLSFTDAAILTVARRSSPGIVAPFDGDFRGIEDLRVIPR